VQHQVYSTREAFGACRRLVAAGHDAKIALFCAIRIRVIMNDKTTLLSAARCGTRQVSLLG
jgi:hypothetical protein